MRDEVAFSEGSTRAAPMRPSLSSGPSLPCGLKVRGVTEVGSTRARESGVNAVISHL